MGAEFLFMDDNVRPHRAYIVDEWLQSEDITRIDWPAYSPDLIPIVLVSDMLGRRIAACQPPPTCLPELRKALLDEWCNIPQDQIDNLILSMPRRLRTPKRAIQVELKASAAAVALMSGIGVASAHLVKGSIAVIQNVDPCDGGSGPIRSIRT
ncbi:transposable element Tcb1 transposase [Trichonephila clavipes]|nr:transposable element Tcb1 transposase [Trichonephila clavipes]